MKHCWPAEVRRVNEWHGPGAAKEDFMFARLMTLQIKENAAEEFPQVLGRQILPLLRNQRGFKEELVLVNPDKTEVTTISLWENKESAEVYAEETYPAISKLVNKYIVGNPVVKTLEVELATLPTFQKFVTVPLN
jgi:heme-degrading monooxygenase HmoA